MKSSMLFPIALCLSLAGCSDIQYFATGPEKPTLEIYTEPAGGYVIAHTGKMMGMAPLSVWYFSQDIEEVQTKDGVCHQSPPVTIVWASGAKIEDRAIWCDSAKRHTVTFKRNMNDPGLEEDLKIAAAVEMKMAYQQEIQRINQIYANAAALQILGNTFNNISASNQAWRQQTNQMFMDADSQRRLREIDVMLNRLNYMMLQRY